MLLAVSYTSPIPTFFIWLGYGLVVSSSKQTSGRYAWLFLAFNDWMVFCMHYLFAPFPCHLYLKIYVLFIPAASKAFPFHFGAHLCSQSRTEHGVSADLSGE